MFLWSNGDVNRLSLLGRGGMEFGTVSVAMVSSATTVNASHCVSVVSALDDQCLAHDRATTCENLKVGHAPAAGRGTVGRGGRSGQGSKGFHGSLLKEWADAAGLAEKGFHGENRTGN